MEESKLTGPSGPGSRLTPMNGSKVNTGLGHHHHHQQQQEETGGNLVDDELFPQDPVSSQEGGGGGELEASLDHSPVALSWENVGVWVKEKGKKKTVKQGKNWAEVRPEPEQGQGQGPETPVKKGHKRIIHGVSGVVQPGSLVALMGASGAGKSNLMNVLANRNVGDYALEGDIKVNGLSVGSGIRKISAYVQQDELFFSTLTVRETLTFRVECPANATRCQYQTGADVLEYVSFTADNNALNYALLAVLLVGFRVISFVILLIRARRSKA